MSTPAPTSTSSGPLGEYMWRRFLADVPWDERLLHALAGVRRGSRIGFVLMHGAWSLTLTRRRVELSNWVYGDAPARLDPLEFERRVEARLEPCQACAHQARFPRLRGWVEYRLRGGAAVFLCPDCTVAAAPAAA